MRTPARRKIGSGEFQFVGGVGEKKFVDQTVPAGSTTITYQLQAVRSTASGEWAQFNVNFGVSDGALTALVTDGVPVKIAA